MKEENQENYFKPEDIMSLEEVIASEEKATEEEADIIYGVLEEEIIKKVRSKEFVKLCIEKGVSEETIRSFVSSGYHPEYTDY